MIEVLRPGLLTTVQDLGRTGYQQYGMVVGGAVDRDALYIGNLLVGNMPYEAGLEITLIGPILKAHQDMTIAITGTPLGALLDGEKVPMWTSLLWEKESTLSFEGNPSGMRAYLVVAGGIDVPVVMGSRSTYIPAQIGGWKGRALQQGDQLCIGVGGMQRTYRRRLAPKYIPDYTGHNVIRVVLGPHVHHFSKLGISTFLTAHYTVSTQLNRMGVRFIGEQIEHLKTADIPSQAVTFGTIQVAADGLPVVMLADRQITGGYTQIATAITIDRSVLAQLKAGEVVCFKEVSLEEAHRLYRVHINFMRQLELLYISK